MFKDHFSDHAKDYAEFRPQYPQKLYAYLAGLVKEHALVWDCGTGNGQAAVALTQHFDEVVASDASADQISHAMQHEKVDYRVMPAEKSNLKNGSVDLITVATALHWFQHEQFFKEVKRVLKPGGVVAAWFYLMHFLEEDDHPEITKLVIKLYYEITGPYWPKERKLVDDKYETIQFPFNLIEAPVFHMEVDWNLTELCGYLNTWSASRKYFAKHGKQPTDEIIQELKQGWPKDKERVHFTWPLYLKVGSW
jgi:ubiquinone/menaquinone biosynthesis C-methylase UbiE